MSITFYVILLLALAALAFLAGYKFRKRKESGQLNRMIQELKESSDKLERSVAENTQHGKAE